MSQAVCDSGRIDAPVLVSLSRAVRVERSTSDHVSASISPRRQPVSARKRVCGDGNRPSGLGHRPQRFPEGGIFFIGRATLAFIVSVLLDPMSGIVRAKTLSGGIREDNAQKRERPRGSPSPARHAGEPMLPRFHTRRGCALTNQIVKSFDVKAGDRCDFQITKQRLYVALDTPSISR